MFFRDPEKMTEELAEVIRRHSPDGQVGWVVLAGPARSMLNARGDWELWIGGNIPPGAIPVTLARGFAMVTEEGAPPMPQVGKVH